MEKGLCINCDQGKGCTYNTHQQVIHCEEFSCDNGTSGTAKSRKKRQIVEACAESE
jgi:hypothetical protein